MLAKDSIGDLVMDPKYKRHSWHQTTSCDLIVRSRYLSGPIGSCHDSCKKGHKAESELTTKSLPERKLMLRSQSERKYLPEVEPSIETSIMKPAFKRLSLPGTKLEKQNQLPTKEIKRCGSGRRGNEVKEIKKSFVADEEKPNLPLSAFWKSRPPKKRSMSLNGRDNVSQTKVEASSKSVHLKRQTSLAEGRARVGMRERSNDSSFPNPMLPTTQKQLRITKSKPGSPVERVATHSRPPKETKKTEQDETNKKESPTWRMKFKKATTSILSSGNLSPKKLPFRTPESTSKNQNDIAVDDTKGSTNRAEVGRKESHEDGAKHQEVVVLRHIETMEGNVTKETKKTEQDETNKNGSPTWRLKFKKATSTILSSGNLSPKKLPFRIPESTSQDHNDVTKNDMKGSNGRVRAFREKSHENGARHQEVVVLKHIETMKDNVIKGSIATEPPKCKKDMVKVLVGAFEALISLGDRKSLVAASAS